MCYNSLFSNAHNFTTVLIGSKAVPAAQAIEFVFAMQIGMCMQLNSTAANLRKQVVNPYLKAFSKGTVAAHQRAPLSALHKGVAIF